MSKLTREAPEIASALAAMLIAIATTGCSTLMEPDHADAALMKSNSGLSANHRCQDFSWHCHVNRKFAGQMSLAATAHAATVAWRQVSIA